MAKRTPLYEKHTACGAKMVEFAGYLMPIQYKSITEEHLAVRSAAGLFDVSHMGELIFKGEGAAELLNYLTVNNTAKLEIGQVQYSAMCYPNGGIIDDLLVYRFPDHYMMVVNAANIEKDFRHISNYSRSEVDITDKSDDTALLALQGPKSGAILQRLTKADLSSVQYYCFIEDEVSGIKTVISRTGYTGEYGFELYVDNENAGKLWDAIMDAGEKDGLKPVGLAARDTLRLEMKYALYGNDISQDTDPFEAGLGWITKMKKGDFIGRAALEEVRKKGISRKLIGFKLAGKVFPRPHYPVYIGGIKVSEVTSGTFSPSLKKGIGLAYLPADKCEIGTSIEVEIRGIKQPGLVVETPFYKSGN